ncbi:CDP-glycerol glycerophosphotransferase family protein [Aeromicrobium sp. UC242_57]|uniref:CDP-glycerol glycerophosphotransferase family protein n=1 Tax=Aeromicrobium sp. UC242_57 TaxID=3374624 RepID=UPI0037937A49
MTAAPDLTPLDATLLVELPPAGGEVWPGSQADDVGVRCQVIVSDAAPGSDERLHDGFDSVSTRFVLLTGPDHIGGGSLAHMLKHGHALAETCGLADFGAPLPLLTAWRDVRVVDAYRSWLQARHPALAADYARQLDDFLYLLRFRAVTTSLHGLDVIDGGSTIRLVGRCRRGGTDGPTPPTDHQPVVIVIDDDDNVLLRAETTAFLTDDRTSPSWIGFTTEIPTNSLPTGRFRLSVEIQSPPGHAPTRTRLQATIGQLASSRPIKAGGRRFQILQVGDTYRLDLLSQSTDVPLDGLRWSAAMAWLDVKAFLRRRPFGGVRMARLLTRPFYSRKPIWLVGERSDTARDNGYHLFAYLRRERPDIRAYYVIDRGSDQYDMMAALGRVVPHSSLRHRMLAMHASALIGAYSIKYLLPKSWDPGKYARQLAWRFGAFRVYLKHGINDKMAVKRRTNGYDLYFTGVEAETKAALEGSGYYEQIVQAGLARFDALVPTPASRTILFMPTWRSYLMPKLFSSDKESERPFEGSDYEQFMLAFLASDRLRDLLDKHDVRLQFMPHYNLADRMSDAPVASDRIDRIGAADANIQDIMRACDLFVTDYSSVHFDLAYLGTPLVYTHFDRDDFQAGHGKHSWFVHERDGFGPVAYDLEGTLDHIEKYLESGCTREQVYEDRAAQAFAYRDTDNCKRTVEHIEGLH